MGLAWVAWPSDENDGGLDVTGPGVEEPINNVRTPASAEGLTADGLRVTVAIDDDTVPLGEAIAIDITVTNESDASMFAGWDRGLKVQLGPRTRRHSRWCTRGRAARGAGMGP